MRERDWHPRVRHSVFLKLVAIMFVMALSLLVLVGGFFAFYVGFRLNSSVNRVVWAYATVVAAQQPDYATAKKIREDLGISIRYEGPGGAWTTSEHLPQIEDAVRGGWTRYPVIQAPNGGRYLFGERFTNRIHEAHTTMIWALLIVMSAVILVTHMLLRRLLRPLRELGAGVERLSAGELDVSVPRRTRDEFGALTDAFNEMAANIRERIRARDQLLLDVSHELRSPVTRMKVALELLPDGEKKSKMSADLAEMEVMIGELLELERLREGRIRKERQNLVPIVESVAAQYGVRVVAPPRIDADIDADKLQTVVRNLIENAMKYSLPDSKPVEVSIAEERDGIAIHVKDDGPGIPDADLQSIFEPFFRVDRSRSRKTGGYGLGLSISKRIVAAHGGTIAAVNNERRGATFVVMIPYPEVDATRAAAPRSPDASARPC